MLHKLLISFVVSFCLFFAHAQLANAASYMQGTARWELVSGAAKYHIYYRETGETTFTHSVRNLSSAATSYKISYLKPGVRYWYRVVAVNAAGKELKQDSLKKLRVAWMP